MQFILIFSFFHHFKLLTNTTIIFIETTLENRCFPSVYLNTKRGFQIFKIIYQSKMTEILFIE